MTKNMDKYQQEAYDRGVQDGKSDQSGSNPYTFSILLDYYAKGFEIGSSLRGQIEIRKLPNPVHDGDWKDPACRWGVYGPGYEFQRFPRKKDAELYRKCRMNSSSFSEATNLYCKEWK